MRRRLAAILLVLTLILSGAPAQSIFAASSNIGDASVYHTPKSDYKSGDCILTASKCMIRRGLIMRGSKAWTKVTNKALRGTATIFGQLRNSYTYEYDGLSFTIDCGNFSGKGDAARIKEFEALLKLHPEGLVVWGSNASINGIHGVLVTGVKDGVVYAADSLHNTGNATKGIQRWKDTSMRNPSAVTKYWYIKEVGLAKNAPRPNPGQPIKALSAGNANYASLLTISDQTIPTTHKQGKGFAVRGIVNSNYRITSVSVGVYNSSGKAVIYKKVNPNTWSYDISKIDYQLKFGTIPVGTFTYKITATDEKSSEVLVDSKFTVTGTSKLRIKSFNYPKKIKQGDSFSIKGKVKSNKKIKRVRVRIVDANGKIVLKASAKPGKKSYNLKKLDAKIKFGKLKRGTYRYVIKATDYVKTKTLVNKKFTVY